MALIVADASVVIKVLLANRAGEEDTEQALALWSRVRAGADRLIQPPHWLAEVTAVLARLSSQTVARDIDDLHAMNVPVVATPEIYRTAARLAVEFDHHLFDTLYHSVALETDSALLVTADDCYYRKAKRLGRILRLTEYAA